MCGEGKDYLISPNSIANSTWSRTYYHMKLWVETVLRNTDDNFMRDVTKGYKRDLKHIIFLQFQFPIFWQLMYCSIANSIWSRTYYYMKLLVETVLRNADDNFMRDVTKGYKRDLKHIIFLRFQFISYKQLVYCSIANSI
jgi:hypothetical protein